MAFATEPELEDYTGASVATARATILLDMATAAIRAYTEQHLSLVTNDVVILPGSFGGTLYLPERPVVSVGAVSINGVATTVNAEWVWDGGDILYRGARQSGYAVNGPDWWVDNGSTWGGDGSQVSVTYTHGYSTIPDDIKGVTLALAARMLATPDGVASESVGGYSVTYSRESAGLALLSGEMQLLDRYRKKVHA